MNKSTKKLQFSAKTKKRIEERDRNRCIFCARSYHMKCRDPIQYAIREHMHYINKSAGGMGIEENGALGCRYHHTLLDNGNKGLRPEMLAIFRKHLQSHYPEWDEKKLVYHKYDF